MKKKLQVFISSTYTDLLPERQAAVEAILRAGHIPAGMELFAAGDKSQMEIIKRWIDDSDVFLLILGGRYGSIEPESGKSYVHIEYEYAVSRNKACFAYVIKDDELERRGQQDYEKFRETQNRAKLEEFRRTLMNGKLVDLWSNADQLKYSINVSLTGTSLTDLLEEKKLRGWVKDEKIDFPSLLIEYNQLRVDNSKLQIKINDYSNLGLTNIYREFLRDSFNEKMEEVTQDSQRSNEIDILQTFAPNLEFFKETLIECLKKGVNIRVLLSWSKSRAVKLREDALRQYTNNSRIRTNVEFEVTKNLETLQEIFDHINCENYQGSLKVRLYNSIPSISMYRINDYFLVGVFLHGRLAVRSFQLELTGTDTTLVNVCSEEFNKIWDMAREIMPQYLGVWRLNLETLF
ncbi:MAG: DUF4062 domain-containing protein [Microcystis sp.]|jgi:hypothetical protein|uniref:DUF4062 domain-containing protein n=1 Tax=Microcystis sp. TaxID=1127 RepID=UPI001D7A71E2|nr:DUF4062 domain-containing protein [Microcystis sp. LE19-12.2C]MDJ0551793.1 DUF4062 domain-containing protein [Microcystis sp. M49637_WE12]NCS27557.1 DUF4062 domain-containing protein [Microcystis aeruginosa F13-15]